MDAMHLHQSLKFQGYFDTGETSTMTRSKYETAANSVTSAKLKKDRMDRTMRSFFQES